MANKKFIYFVSLSSNAAYVIKQSLEMVKQQHEVAIFFDLDGARVLDQRYFNNRNSAHDLDLGRLLQSALASGIKLYGCQMNILIADGLQLIEGAELAGVVTFLELAYAADAVISY
ncbi:MAG: DsrE family protein [Paenisporosarcina sp.]|uniref:sulfur reductase DrsE n=1 Tax=Paenisporosarcina sp. TaxID=1932001 RepID=UPI003C708AB5